MKKMWKLNNKAVSPVIATILMVAITVVLAAVLYVMVMGFGGGGSDETPTASLTYDNNTQGNYTVSISSISANDVTVSQVQWVVDGTVYDWNDMNTWTSGQKITWVGSTIAADSPVIAGSSITVAGLASGAHTIALLYTPTNNNAGTVTINVP